MTGRSPEKNRHRLRLKRASAVGWALKTAFQINAPLLICVFVLVSALSVLPAVSLGFNREVIDRLSSFIATGAGSFDAVLPPLLFYGALLAVITVSSRVNTDFIASLTDNVYSFGMQERLIAAVHDADMIELLRKNVNEDFNYIVRQSRALNRIVGGLCSIGGKAFSLGSLAVVAYSLSRPVFFVALAYVAVAVALSLTFSKGTRANYTKFRKEEVKAQFLQNMPLEANIAKEVRVYGCADEVVSSWRAAYSTRLGMLLETYRATERSALATGVSFYLFLAVVVAYLLWGVSAGNADPAVLLTVLTLCTNLFSSLSVFMRDLILLDENLFAVEQQRDLLFANARGGAACASSAQAPDAVASPVAPAQAPDAAPGSLARTQDAAPAAPGSPTQSQDAPASPGSLARTPAASPGSPSPLRRPAHPDALSTGGSRADDPVFSVRGLTFSYDGVRQTLRGVDLDIRKGEVVALVGENGSGKTTLVKVLMGVFKPDDGVVLFRGAPMASCTADELSASIGAFFQDFYLFHHTLAENVAYGDVRNIGDEGRVRHALALGGAERIAADMPDGLSTLIGRRIERAGVELSGGQKQLVAASRAYMGDKDVLIFDEPASMLDPLAEIEQFRTIRNRVEGKTGILISHRVGFARLADRIVMMEAGRVAEQGTHDELMAKNGLYAAFFREQARWYESGGVS